ncbi:MAG: hypothetical protein IPJ61_10580 [Tessaracoccus sp.]|uniref:hypothetical protein n=1 Tax=Tessaracoccus sp. TaxID=1971211 RepID=UPI001EBC4C90|nr:hypothetical protein [Tessaracoccus sp.]MBK7821495.1 hypothetical protein [Tessaracoccus sp.]
MSVVMLVSIGLAVLFAAATVGFTSRSRSARTAVIGIGWTALPIGLWLTGVTDLTINGIASLVAWFQRTPFTTATAWGLGLLIGGIVFVVVGAMLPKKDPAERPRKQVKPADAGRSAVPPVKTGQRPQVQGGQPAKPAPAAKPAPKQAQKGLDPEDAEIEELLRKRGIM